MADTVALVNAVVAFEVQISAVPSCVFVRLSSDQVRPVPPKTVSVWPPEVGASVAANATRTSPTFATTPEAFRCDRPSEKTTFVTVSVPGTTTGLTLTVVVALALTGLLAVNLKPSTTGPDVTSSVGAVKVAVVVSAPFKVTGGPDVCVHA